MRYNRLLTLLPMLSVQWTGPIVAQDAQRICAPTPHPLSVGATAKGLAGRYRLQIVGTDGKAKSQVVSGTLTLWAPPDSFQSLPRGYNQQMRLPLIGTADIDFSRVGGVDDGGWTSTDPAAPGIVVQEHQGTYQNRRFTTITLHIGADGNRRGRLRADGPYNALYVDKIDSTGFWGRWHASLGYSTYKANGYFCAIRN